MANYRQDRTYDPSKAMSLGDFRDTAYRGLASALGAPVDILSGAMRPFGYNIPEQNVIGGSEWMGKKFEDMGLVSQARNPYTEFLGAMMFPDPTDIATASKFLGASVLPGMAKHFNDTPNISSRLKHDITMDNNKIGQVTTSRNGDFINIDDIEVFKSGTGKGTEAIKEVMKYADENGLTVSLTSDAMRGKKNQELNRKLYEKLGFIKNKGGNKIKGLSEEFYYKGSKNTNNNSIPLKPIKTISDLKVENKSTYPKIPTKNVFYNTDDYAGVPKDKRSSAEMFFDKPNELPIEEVDTRKIVPTQKNVTAKNIEEVRSISNYDEPIIAVEHEGKYYLLDGHHRTASAIMDGEEKIPIHVYR